MGSITWPAVATVAIVAIMITVLIIAGHANTVTVACAALGSVALAIAHAFIAQRERALVSRQVNEALRAADSSRTERERQNP